MRLYLALFVASFAAALPAEYVQLDPELAARRANITERMVDIHDRQAAVSVDERFKGKGKLWFGTATDRGLLQREKNSAIIQANFGQVTPENSMKWQSLESTRGQYNWGDADYLVDFATQNNKYIRGHTLVWHSQLPSWVASINNANTLREVLRTHVQTVVGRYKGKIHSWDVVNEIFNEDGTLRNSVFSRLLGEEFVSIAFREARAADPTARLYINDYNLDRPNISKVNQMRYYVDKWISEGIPIDGIGSQAHLGAGGGGPVQGAIQQLATAAVTEVSITELDIASAPANDYTAVVRGCLNTPKCVGITVWGISDKDSWRSGTSPLLFDNSFNPKGAYNSIVGIL